MPILPLAEMMGRSGREGREWDCLVGETSASSEGTMCELQDALPAIFPYLTHDLSGTCPVGMYPVLFALCCVHTSLP